MLNPHLSRGVRRALAVAAAALLVGAFPAPAYAEGKCFTDPTGDQAGGSGPLDLTEVCHGNTSDTITYRLKMAQGFEDPQQAEIAVFLNLEGDEFQMEAAIAAAFFQGETRVAAFANPQRQPGQTFQPQTVNPSTHLDGGTSEDGAQSGIQDIPRAKEPPRRTVSPATEDSGLEPTEPAQPSADAAQPAPASSAGPTAPDGTDLTPETLAAWQEMLSASGWAWLSQPSDAFDLAQYTRLAQQAQAVGFDIPQPPTAGSPPDAPPAADEPVARSATTEPDRPQPQTTQDTQRAEPRALGEMTNDEIYALIEQDTVEARQDQPEPPRIEGVNATITHDAGSDTLTFTLKFEPLRAHGLGNEGERYEYVVATNDGSAADKAPNEALFLHNLDPPGDLPASGQAEAPPTAADVQQAQGQSSDGGSGNLPRNGAAIELYTKIGLLLLLGGVSAVGAEALIRHRWRADGPVWEGVQPSPSGVFPGQDTQRVLVEAVLPAAATLGALTSAFARSRAAPRTVPSMTSTPALPPGRSVDPDLRSWLPALPPARTAHAGIRARPAALDASRDWRPVGVV